MTPSRAQLGFRFAKPGDICARKHKHNPQSVSANEKANPGKTIMRERVRLFVSGCGPAGTTLKEICHHFAKLPHTLSGRISELKADGLIFDSGRTESGFTVLVGHKTWVNGSSAND